MMLDAGRSSHHHICILASAKLSCFAPLPMMTDGGEHCCFSKRRWVMAIPLMLARYGAGLHSIRIFPCNLLWSTVVTGNELAPADMMWLNVVQRYGITFRGIDVFESSSWLVEDLLWFGLILVGLRFFACLGFEFRVRRECVLTGCDTDSRNTFYPHIRFSVLAVCLNPWAGFCRRCIISVSQIQSFWQSLCSSTGPMAFL